MTLKPQPGSGVNGPLWLIAISLLTIAICMVFLVIDKQFAAPKESPRTDANMQNSPTAPRSDRLLLTPGTSPRRSAPFGDLASPHPSGPSPATPEFAPEPMPGFLPTTMEPLPG